MIDVKKIAKLAKLQITAEEEKRYQKQLESVVQHFYSLKEVNTDSVEVFVSPVENSKNWRPDRVENTIDREAAMAEAPELTGELFQVPPVV